MFCLWEQKGWRRRVRTERRSDDQLKVCPGGRIHRRMRTEEGRVKRRVGKKLSKT